MNVPTYEYLVDGRQNKFEISDFSQVFLEIGSKNFFQKNLLACALNNLKKISKKWKIFRQISIIFQKIPEVFRKKI